MGASSKRSSEFSIRTRAANLARMSSEVFDVAVIGGGITGAGIALDAVSRGLSVALIEKRDFASGASSRSTKLIHGGLRYLRNFEFRLVRESLRERATLSRIAPHLAEPLAFVIPLYDATKPSPLGRNSLKLRLGLWLYDRLAGRENIAPHRRLSKEETLELAPMLSPDGLTGALLYYDAVTDDARLVIEVVKTAARAGSVIANYAEAVGFMKEDGHIRSIRVVDRLAGGELHIRARVFINASGVWSDEVARFLNGRQTSILRPSKGIHIVVPARRLRNQAAVLIPSIGEQRFLFVVPWHGQTMIGTTDADYRGDLDDPPVEQAEIDRVLRSASLAFPAADLSAEDVVGAFAGLRPLVATGGKSTAELSRKDEIIEDPSGLISIIGGKLTTYRLMAERATDLAASRLEKIEGVARKRAHRCLTEEIELAGGRVPRDVFEKELAWIVSELNISEETVRHLAHTYAGNYRRVLDIARGDDDLKTPLARDLPQIAAEAVYAARHEMAVTAEDFLFRRTRIGLIAREVGRSCTEQVAELLRVEHEGPPGEIDRSTGELVAPF
jgi:glycerol-3-phosphate dehydrogenase